MVVTEQEAVRVSATEQVDDTSGANRTFVEPIAKGHRCQAHFEAVGCDRTYVGPVLGSWTPKL